MKHLIRDTFILFVITLVSGALLGFVNELTKEPIAQYEAERKVIACSEVFKEEDENGALTETVSLQFEPAGEEEILVLNNTLKDSFSGNVAVTELYRAYKTEDMILLENETQPHDSVDQVNEKVLHGYVIGITTKEGYNGDISFYVGISEDGKVKGVSLLNIAETPGLGMNAEAVLLPQFRNVDIEQFHVVKTGAKVSNEIDAISGATVTSDAITEGVNVAGMCYTLLQEGGDAE